MALILGPVLSCAFTKGCNAGKLPWLYKLKELCKPKGESKARNFALALAEGNTGAKLSEPEPSSSSIAE